MDVGDLFYVVIVLLAILILVGLVFWVLKELRVSEPLSRYIKVVVAVIAVIVLVAVLLSLAGVGFGTRVGPPLSFLQLHQGIQVEHAEAKGLVSFNLG